MRLKEIKNLVKQISKDDVEKNKVIKEILEVYDPKEKEKLEEELFNLDSIKINLFKDLSNLTPQIKEKMIQSYDQFLKEKVKEK